MRLAHHVSGFDLPAQIHFAHAGAVVVLEARGLCLLRVYRLKDRLVDPLRVRRREHVLDVPLRRLAVIPKSRRKPLLVLRLFAVCKQRSHLLAVALLHAPAPPGDLRRERGIVRLCLVHVQNAPRVLAVLNVLRRKLSAQQPVQYPLILVRQQIPALHPLIGASGFPLPLVELFYLRLRLRRFLRQLRPLAALCPRSGGSQRGFHVLHGSLKVIPCPPLIVPAVALVRLVQRLLRDLDLIRHLDHAHKLIRRVHDRLREQPRRFVVELSVQRVDADALVVEQNFPAHRPPELLKVCKLRPHLRRHPDARLEQFALDMLERVVELAVLLNSRVVGVLKALVDRLLRDPPGFQELVHHALHGRLQHLALCLARNAHRVRRLPHRAVHRLIHKRPRLPRQLVVAVHLRLLSRLRSLPLVTKGRWRGAPEGIRAAPVLLFRRVAALDHRKLRRLPAVILTVWRIFPVDIFALTAYTDIGCSTCGVGKRAGNGHSPGQFLCCIFCFCRKPKRCSIRQNDAVRIVMVAVFIDHNSHVSAYSIQFYRRGKSYRLFFAILVIFVAANFNTPFQHLRQNCKCCFFFSSVGIP